MDDRQAGAAADEVNPLVRRDHGLQVSCATLRRYGMDELGWRLRTATVLVADAPAGEEAQVDFGLMGTMYDPQRAGRARAADQIMLLDPGARLGKSSTAHASTEFCVAVTNVG